MIALKMNFQKCTVGAQDGERGRRLRLDRVQRVALLRPSGGEKVRVLREIFHHRDTVHAIGLQLLEALPTLHLTV